MQLVHVVTKKGKGYEPAEKDPTKYHGVPSFDPELGITDKDKHGQISFSEGFGSWLCARAKMTRNLLV